jgi:KUP system potassium uptake protein
VGTGLFFVRDCAKTVPSYVVQTMLDNGIIYEDNVLVSILQKDEPFGIAGYFKDDLAPGLRFFEIDCGYMELPHIERILHHAGVTPQAIFYGLDIVVTKHLIWRIYALIKQLAPTFVQFHKLPYNKLHGVVTIVEL